MSKKKTIEEVSQYFAKEGYILLATEYINNSTPMEYICPNGHTHAMSWHNFSHGKRCPECRGLLKYTLETASEKFKERGCVLLATEYKNNKTKMKCLCPNKHEWETSLDNLLHGYGCPKCAGQVITYEEVKESFEKEGLTLLSKEYKNAKTKLEYVCPKGHKHSMTWNDFTSGNRCPKCNMSKGEKAIENYLIKNAIKYIAQYRFEDCRNLLPLPFDFYIPSLNTCIEYDGIQHFEVRKHFHENEESLKERQRLDNIKTQYCLDNDIKLIRISYLEFNNIETILTQTLNL